MVNLKTNEIKERYVVKKNIFLIFAFVFILAACNSEQKIDDRLYVVATTSMLGDLVEQIGGENIRIKTLMGPGVDPHLYELKPSDVSALGQADIIVINGLNLEGKIVSTIATLKSQGKKIVIVGDDLEEKDLIEQDGVFDPHVWFDITLWKEVAVNVSKHLKQSDAESADYYETRLSAYLEELDELHQFVLAKINELPEEKRILITAHDAFAYFGRAYGFEVHAIQGISTDSEPSTKDIEDLANFVVEHQVNAIFFESSIPESTVQSVIANAKAKGWDVSVGGELYSDALGDKESDAETYVKTMKHNITTIVDALK